MISSCFLGKLNVDRKKKQAENISVDEGTRIRHRELSHSLSEVALMKKSIIILFVIHVVACDGVNGISVQRTLCSVQFAVWAVCLPRN